MFRLFLVYVFYISDLVYLFLFVFLIILSFFLKYMLHMLCICWSLTEYLITCDPATEQHPWFNSACTRVTAERSVTAAARSLVHSYTATVVVIALQTALFWGSLFLRKFLHPEINKGSDLVLSNVFVHIRFILFLHICENKVPRHKPKTKATNVIEGMSVKSHVCLFTFHTYKCSKRKCEQGLC